MSVMEDFTEEVTIGIPRERPVQEHEVVTKVECAE